ncbi:MAG: potassium-transporting ATPase subunit KdpB [Thermoplasmatota archaeon]
MAPPKPARRSARGGHVMTGTLVRQAIGASFRKLDPRTQVRNPVMFVVFIGAILVTAQVVWSSRTGLPFFEFQIALWLWFTVLFANFAEAIAEGRGKAQAESLREVKAKGIAHVVQPDDLTTTVNATDLKQGDVVRVTAGEVIPADGTIIKGVATVDESAITGESAPVVRESGGDRSAVTGGTRVLSDAIDVEVTAKPGHSFLDRMIQLVESARRQKTPNELALSILFTGLTVIFLAVCVTLVPFGSYSGINLSVPVIVALLVCLIPTTIGALMSAIGIAGMDRLLRANVVAKSGRAVEAAGDIDIILLDKTGTITLGNRQAVKVSPAPEVLLSRLHNVTLQASAADDTPEGRSIVDLVRKSENRLAPLEPKAAIVKFSAQTRMSGVDLPDGRQLRKGAPSAVQRHIETLGGLVPQKCLTEIDVISQEGGTPLLVAEGKDVLGVIQLKDVVKPGISDRLRILQRMGIRTVMITGDNPKTAAAIAKEAGVDEYVAEATPEDKLEFIKRSQTDGRLVAMIGDGTNDAPALAQSDVGVAMNTGTQAAREAGNMVDLDSSPTKLIDVIEIGKQLLITRGALTTFSISNDVAKYFAILPAMFAGVYPELNVLNVMKLATPQSAILSAVIFNALIIVALVPLALRGVKYRPAGAASILRRNLLIYGLGGIIAPFVGIKAIDLAIHGLRWA